MAFLRICVSHACVIRIPQCVAGDMDSAEIEVLQHYGDSVCGTAHLLFLSALTYASNRLQGAEIIYDERQDCDDLYKCLSIVLDRKKPSLESVSRTLLSPIDLQALAAS